MKKMKSATRFSRIVWMLIARNSFGGAPFMLDGTYTSRREASWNKKRLGVSRGYRPVRVEIREVIK